MLKINSKSMDFNGVSVIDDIAVASMHASYNGNNDMYLNMSISEINAYIAHKDVVAADFAAFCDAIVAVVGAQAEEPDMEPEVQE